MQRKAWKLQKETKAAEHLLLKSNQLKKIKMIGSHATCCSLYCFDFQLDLCLCDRSSFSGRERSSGSFVRSFFLSLFRCLFKQHVLLEHTVQPPKSTQLSSICNARAQFSHVVCFDTFVDHFCHRNSSNFRCSFISLLQLFAFVFIYFIYLLFWPAPTTLRPSRIQVFGPKYSLPLDDSQSKLDQVINSWANKHAHVAR